MRPACLVTASEVELLGVETGVEEHVLKQSVLGPFQENTERSLLKKHIKQFCPTVSVTQPGS